MRHIERWLFAPVDPRALAAFRVVLAAAIVAVLLMPARWVGWGAGIVPARVHQVLAAAAVAAYVAGWRPRVTGAALAAVLAPIAAHRLSAQVLLIALGATSLLRADARRGGGASSGPMWPLRLVQLELSAIYLWNALAKTTPAYLSGDVLAGFAATLPNFVAEVRDGMLHVGPIAAPLALAATSSVAAEYALALGFWVPRLRIATALFGVAFHLVLKAIIQINMLDWACMALYLAFLLPFHARR